MANPTSQKQRINEVAKQFNLSPETLWGIYGTESSYGLNPHTSSAGAEGPFQFIPSTAMSYGLTTGPNGTVQNFDDSLIAAASYLVHLGANNKPRSKGTIEAINAYNGNQGGDNPNTTYAQEVFKNGKTPLVGTKSHGPKQEKEALESGVLETLTPEPEVKEKLKELGSWGTGIKDIAAFLLSKEGWDRIFKIVGGGILFFIAARELFPGPTQDVQQGAIKTANKVGDIIPQERAAKRTERAVQKSREKTAVTKKLNAAERRMIKSEERDEKPKSIPAGKPRVRPKKASGE